MPHRNTVAARVARWFHTEDADELTPADTVSVIATNILQAAQSAGFEIAYSKHIFRILLCEFLCTLYHAALTGKDVRGPHTRPHIPESWTNDIFHSWIDYLHREMFTNTFWEDFWAHIPKCEGLERIRNWGIEIQTLIPYLLKPDHHRMIEMGLLFEDHEGNAVAAEDYEFGPEDSRDGW